MVGNFDDGFVYFLAAVVVFMLMVYMLVNFSSC